MEKCFAVLYDGAMKNINVKKAASWVGSALMVVSLGFIGRQLYLSRDGIDFTVLTDPLVLVLLLAVAVLEGAGIIIASFNYRALVKNVSGIKVKSSLAVTVYSVSNLYKYIPGGVMYILGRNKMAIDTDDLSHGKVALATVIEGTFFALAAIVITVAFSFNHAVYYIRQMEMSVWVLLVYLTALLIIVFVVWRFRGRLLVFFRNLKNDTQDLRLAVMLKRFCYAFVLISLWAFSFLATLILLGQPVTFATGFTIMGLFMLSWVAGFLTPGAPSGLGIREFVMMMFMGDTLNVGILISAMVMHRILTVIGDIAAYGIALIYAQIRKRVGENG